MLSLLTKYLLQFHRLVIPHVGSFELVQHPAAYNVVDKLLVPPYFSLSWNNNDVLSEHQLHFLASCIKSDPESIKTELDQFGKRLSAKVQKDSFAWNGIGRLRHEGGSIAVDQEPMILQGLGSVPAHKVMRENVEHSMLVGDQQMTSQQVTDTLARPGKKRSVTLLIGWILLVVTILAILFLLYRNGFSPLSSGLKMKVAP